EVADQHPFRNLKDQSPRGKSRLEKYCVHEGWKIAVAKLHWRKIDSNLKRIGPARRLFACLPQNPLPHMQYQPAFFGNRDEDVGWHIPARRVLPARQGLEADDLAADSHLR